MFLKLHFPATTKNPSSPNINPATKAPKLLKQPRIWFQFMAGRDEIEPSQTRVPKGSTLEEAHELGRGNVILHL